MKTLTEKRSIKIIALMLVVITASVMVFPNYVVYAETDDGSGGKLFKPICQLFAKIGDLVIQLLQKYFIKDTSIKVFNGSEIDTKLDDEDNADVYIIRYGPALIFMNRVPALDANFINPRYPENNKYKVTKMPGYHKNDDNSHELNKKTECVDDLIARINNIIASSGGTQIQNSDIEITMISENTGSNEYLLELRAGKILITVDGR